MSEFFERPVLGGRIGNDLEPMLFHGDTVGKVAAALINQLADPDPTIRRLALEALVTIRGDRSRPTWPGRSRGDLAIPTARSARGPPR